MSRSHARILINRTWHIKNWKEEVGSVDVEQGCSHTELRIVANSNELV